MTQEEIKNRLTCLDEIIAYMKDDKVTWRDVSDDIIIDILKKYNLYDCEKDENKND